jgi:amino acid transporter
VDDRDRCRGDHAAVHPLLPRPAARHRVRDHARDAVDDPLTFLAISSIFNPSVVDFSQLTHFRHTTGTGFFSPIYGHGWLTISIAFSFLLTWNVIAMEAAACYVGETKNPDRDAKIAMNLEAGYGVFIYTMIPIAFVIVLGLHALGNTSLVDPKAMFVSCASKVFGTSNASTVLDDLIAIMLIIALVLSALNAITGTARSPTSSGSRRLCPTCPCTGIEGTSRTNAPRPRPPSTRVRWRPQVAVLERRQSLGA